MNRLVLALALLLCACGNQNSPTDHVPKTPVTGPQTEPAQ